MLIKCKECELQVSDKAISCPHCGYPLKEPSKNRQTSKTKRKRLPNGFGQITELKGRNLRKPFRAMVSVGTNDKGRPIQKLLKPESYFESYNDAYTALLEYNKNPYDLNKAITVSELYEKWSDEYFKTTNPSGKRTIMAAWAYCDSVKKMRALDLRARHIKNCMNNGTVNINGVIKTASPSTKTKIKSMFNLMLDYAVEYEIVNKNYARTFTISKDVTEDVKATLKEHIAFTDEELRILWNNSSIRFVKIILIQCYTGFRPQEMGLLERKKIDLVKNIIIGGMKTDSGTDRIVPIHSNILGFVKEFYEESEQIGSDYLLNTTDGRDNTILTYDKYRKRFEKVVKLLALNPEHRAHDPRKTFVTLCKKYNVNEYAIKHMVGHSISDITESVYTERDPDWLKRELDRIPVYEH